MAMRLRLRWIAIVSGTDRGRFGSYQRHSWRGRCHQMLMAGADVIMLCSILLRRGTDQIRVIEREVEEWMEPQEYDSVEELEGSMIKRTVPIRRRSRVLNTFGVSRPPGV
jgi:dihydroorotate dehydrogenase (fumarate)